ncbi:MAG: hypoxanthine phosphoribosyltransferase [Eubacterium sp.]|jgi:hypoxanthine phosphoribosyltransferase
MTSSRKQGAGTVTVGKILYTEEDIRKRAKELGKQITKDYEGEELVILCTLKGAFLWMADLTKNIDLDTQIDFISASSYGSGTSTSGVVKVTKDVNMDLFNKNVLIVEDIVDTGTTLKFLKSYLEERNPKSVRICTMLDKPSRRIADIKPDYTGFTVDDIFIVGYGLDYDQKYRNLPYISFLEG